MSQPAFADMIEKLMFFLTRNNLTISTVLTVGLVLSLNTRLPGQVVNSEASRGLKNFRGYEKRGSHRMSTFRRFSTGISGGARAGQADALAVNLQKPPRLSLKTPLRTMRRKYLGQIGTRRLGAKKIPGNLNSLLYSRPISQSYTQVPSGRFAPTEKAMIPFKRIYAKPNAFTVKVGELGKPDLLSKTYYTAVGLTSLKSRLRTNRLSTAGLTPSYRKTSLSQPLIGIKSPFNRPLTGSSIFSR